MIRSAATKVMWSTTSWTARVDKNALTDNYTVVVLCANQ